MVNSVKVTKKGKDKPSKSITYSSYPAPYPLKKKIGISDNNEWLSVPSPEREEDNLPKEGNPFALGREFSWQVDEENDTPTISPVRLQEELKILFKIDSMLLDPDGRDRNISKCLVWTTPLELSLDDLLTFIKAEANLDPDQITIIYRNCNNNNCLSQTVIDKDPNLIDVIKDYLDYPQRSDMNDSNDYSSGSNQDAPLTIYVEPNRDAYFDFDFDETTEPLEEETDIDDEKEDEEEGNEKNDMKPRIQELYTVKNSESFNVGETFVDNFTDTTDTKYVGSPRKTFSAMNSTSKNVTNTNKENFSNGDSAIDSGVQQGNNNEIVPTDILKRVLRGWNGGRRNSMPKLGLLRNLFPMGTTTNSSARDIISPLTDSNTTTNFENNGDSKSVLTSSRTNIHSFNDLGQSNDSSPRYNGAFTISEKTNSFFNLNNNTLKRLSNYDTGDKSLCNSPVDHIMGNILDEKLNTEEKHLTSDPYIKRRNTDPSCSSSFAKSEALCDISESGYLNISSSINSSLTRSSPRAFESASTSCPFYKSPELHTFNEKKENENRPNPKRKMINSSSFKYNTVSHASSFTYNQNFSPRSPSRVRSTSRASTGIGLVAIESSRENRQVCGGGKKGYKSGKEKVYAKTERDYKSINMPREYNYHDTKSSRESLSNSLSSNSNHITINVLPHHINQDGSISNTNSGHKQQTPSVINNQSKDELPCKNVNSRDTQENDFQSDSSNEPFKDEVSFDEENKVNVLKKKIFPDFISVDDQNYQKIEVDKNMLFWKKGKRLGQGSFGAVYSALDLRTGKRFVVKEIEYPKKVKRRLQSNKEDVNDNDYEKLQREVYYLEYLEHLRHPNIIKYLGTKSTNSKLTIFLEYASDGSLKSMLEEFGALSEAVTRTYVAQILKGLNYLHEEARIIHSDIKTANILLHNGVIKLADFGTAHKVTNTANTGKPKRGMDELGGTLCYMAPEVLNQQNFGRRSDIWSLGITIIEMAQGDLPWKTFMDSMESIEGQRPMPELPSIFSNEAKDFVSRCLVKDHTKRAYAKELMEHAFVNAKHEPRLQSHMLYVPRRRPSFVGDPMISNEDSPRKFEDYSSINFNNTNGAVTFEALPSGNSTLVGNHSDKTDILCSTPNPLRSGNVNSIDLINPSADDNLPMSISTTRSSDNKALNDGAPRYLNQGVFSMDDDMRGANRNTSAFEHSRPSPISINQKHDGVNKMKSLSPITPHEPSPIFSDSWGGGRSPDDNTDTFSFDSTKKNNREDNPDDEMNYSTSQSQSSSIDKTNTTRKSTDNTIGRSIESFDESTTDSVSPVLMEKQNSVETSISSSYTSSQNEGELGKSNNLSNMNPKETHFFGDRKSNYFRQNNDEKDSLTPQINYDNLPPVVDLDAETPIDNMKPLYNDHVHREMPGKVKLDEEMKNNPTKAGCFDFAKMTPDSPEFQAVLEEVGIIKNK